MGHLIGQPDLYDTPPSEGIQRTDLRFYLVTQIPAAISGVPLPSVVVGTYGYHYI